MFGFARYVVRHKIGAVAIVALGAFVMSPDGDEPEDESNNPWAVRSAPAQVAVADESSFMDDIVDEAVSYLDETGLNPVDRADETVGQLENTAEALSAANSRN